MAWHCRREGNGGERGLVSLWEEINLVSTRIIIIIVRLIMIRFGNMYDFILFTVLLQMFVYVGSENTSILLSGLFLGSRSDPTPTELKYM